MLRYTSDRFIDIELVTNIKTGLKIPVSSIVNKDFYVIPKGYETTGGESDEIGFLKETTNKSGETSSEFVNATVYAQQEDLYYVDQEDFSDGDVIIKPESTERYTIGDTMPLEGVYCINKGYAVFRKVVIIDQNEEYCIVESGTTYGIAQFDNIVSDSSTVKRRRNIILEGARYHGTGKYENSGREDCSSLQAGVKRSAGSYTDCSEQNKARGIDTGSYRVRSGGFR